MEQRTENRFLGFGSFYFVYFLKFIFQGTVLIGVESAKGNTHN
jgi:hypothetical protein